ncbi:restriction endonuclease subunit S [Pseudomonas putida]|jgi:type I restriction enzyme S subunit|uniref:restriction endonuclease subunit S n=1 Tax=Pseudomonas putida TaxID=303 RepID=UPI00162729E5|nr:restriction endonuclease subunit S [Pseudomonas putida]EKT4471311.1 restriction endonuclease subunit S [Pseudomonas putida]EKT4494131.1 restriction endonuclease subunit S [Pseudomonas putida]EKT8865017.1 restriction endonuclease subunit S [Pseudomonas putida]QNG07665.1 restriction endonuclease subunit S [Pseudomonas putida]HDS1060076.1 restriction endonuclease subunit S [Pseudomonas putida]
MSTVLTDNLPLLAGAPKGIKKLRELILELAVRGKLVPQDPSDEPASELLKRIAEEKARLVAEGKVKKQKTLAEFGEEAEPFELPAGWSWGTLAQVAFVNPRNAAADSLEVSFVPMTFIGTRFDDQHAQEPRLWGEVKQGFTHFAEGDIGVAKITPCFENSKACVFSKLVNGLGAGTTELHIVRPVGGTLDPRFVLAYLKSPKFLLVGETKMTGTAGQKRLPKDFVETNPFPLPPLPEQHRIVAKVDELMALCDRLEARQGDAESAHAQLVQTLLSSLTQASDAEDFAQSWQRLTEYFHTLFTTESSIDSLKQTLLQLAVMGKLVEQDPSDEPASELLKRIAEEKVRLAAEGKIKKPKPLPQVGADERLREISNGWELVRFGELIELISGQHLGPDEYFDTLQDGAIPYLTGPAEFGEVHPQPTRFTYERRATSIQGDILLTVKGSGVGKTNFVDQEELAISRQLMAIRPVLLDTQFTRYLLLSMAEHFQSKSIGIAIPGISREDVLDTPMGLPPLQEQNRIVAKVDQLMALCDQLKARINQARQVHEHLTSALVEQAVA